MAAFGFLLAHTGAYGSDTKAWSLLLQPVTRFKGEHKDAHTQDGGHTGVFFIQPTVDSISTLLIVFMTSLIKYKWCARVCRF